MSNSLLLVFYSENNYMTIYGYVKNWKKTGYFEAYDFPGKYSVNSLTNSIRHHLDKVMINGHNSFNINALFSVDNESYREIHSYLKT